MNIPNHAYFVAGSLYVVAVCILTPLVMYVALGLAVILLVCFHFEQTLEKVRVSMVDYWSKVYKGLSGWAKLREEPQAIKGSENV